MRAAACWFLLVHVISLSLVASSMPSLRAMALADAARIPPPWLKPLLVDTTFFEECRNHPETNCNYFCAVCFGRGALCTGCLPSHPGHHVIQIRKLSGHGVVRVADAEALELNVSDVQPYLHNGHFVMFLNKRPMAGRGRAGEIRCEECERALLDVHYRFCSMGCKTWSGDCTYTIGGRTVAGNIYTLMGPRPMGPMGSALPAPPPGTALKLEALPDDLDFTVTFAVPPKNDSESGGSDSDCSSGAQKGAGEAGTSAAASKPQTTAAAGAGPSSSGHQRRRQNNSVPKNI